MDTSKRPAFVPTLPRTLYLETTNRCDSACQTCIRTFHTLEPPKDLTLAELQQIVEQFPVLERVVLHGIGEPLLNKQIFEIVAYLKTRGATVLFNSDAISLTQKRAAQLIDSVWMNTVSRWMRRREQHMPSSEVWISSNG